jgi:hypothetical protein
MKSKENDGFHADSWLKDHPLPIHFLRSAMESIYPSNLNEEEMAALRQNKTWELVPKPVEVNPISCKWVYKVKTRADG